MWSCASGVCPHPAAVAAHSNAIYELDWSADGRHLLTAAGDRLIKLWDAESMTLLAEFGRHSRTVKAVTFLPEDSCEWRARDSQGAPGSAVWLSEV